MDVQLALGLLECVLGGGCDVAILISNDTDMVPVIEAVARLKGPERIETAAWYSALSSARLRTRLPIWHHQLDESVFKRFETPINYAHAG